MNNTKGLVNAVLYELGLDVDINNNIIDQDNGGTQLLFQGKRIKYNLKYNISCTPNEVSFDIITNEELMKYIFNFYIGKCYTIDHKYFYAIADLQNDIAGRSAKELRAINSIIQSSYYYNKCLIYIDLILKINGRNYFDLSAYDYNSCNLRR